jgi:hypothetical protein
MSRLIALIVTTAVVVGAVLAATGVLRFQNTRDEAAVTIDKKQLKEKTQKAIEKAEKTGGGILDKTGEALQKAGRRM